MRLAHIYRPTKNAMQSGKAKHGTWVLEFESLTDDGSSAPQKTRFSEHLMGWTSGTDMDQEIRIRFDSKEAAIAYAEKHHLEYDVTEPQQEDTIIKSYAENFK